MAGAGSGIGPCAVAASPPPIGSGPHDEALDAERVQQREGAAQVHERVVAAQLVQHDVGRVDAVDRRLRGGQAVERLERRACGPLPGAAQRR